MNFVALQAMELFSNALGLGLSLGLGLRVGRIGNGIFVDSVPCYTFCERC